MKRKIIYFIITMFLAMPLLQSCGSSKCKAQKYKGKPAKCWNAKKQKYTRC